MGVARNPDSYAIIGTGAIGGYYGARLQQAGFEVHFLANSDVEHLAQRGLVVDSVDGDFHLPDVRVYSSVSQMPVCDVVMVALKTTQNHLLSQLLPAVVKPDGIVVTLQNGLGVEPAIADIVGPSVQVLGGMCFICSNKVGPGHIHHLDYGHVKLGAYGDGYQALGVTAAMQHIANDFARAHLHVIVEDNLLLARWKKLVWNIPFNSLSVILNATTAEMMADDGVRSLTEHLMQEVVMGAAAYGQTIPKTFVDKMLVDTARMKPYLTSMKLDYDGRRPLEVEAICGNPLRAARDRGLTLPYINAIYQQLRFLDRQNRVEMSNEQN